MGGGLRRGGEDEGKGFRGGEKSKNGRDRGQ